MTVNWVLGGYWRVKELEAIPYGPRNPSRGLQDVQTEISKQTCRLLAMAHSSCVPAVVLAGIGADRWNELPENVTCFERRGPPSNVRLILTEPEKPRKFPTTGRFAPAFT